MYNVEKLAKFHHVSQSKYLGPVKFRALFKRYGTEIDSIFSLTDKELLELPGISKQVLKGIREQENNFNKSKDFMEKQIEMASKCGGGIVTIDDNSYPNVLKASSMCHPILYYKGNLNEFIQYEKAIAIVGSRKASIKSQEIARKTALELATKGWVIVSGLALGIDSSAHIGALQANGLTIAILGCGPDIIYPKDSKTIYEDISTKGVIISEFPFGTKIEDWKLRKRNKTTVAAAMGAFVVETAEKGGAMNAVKACKEQKKKVFTVAQESDYQEHLSGNKNIIDNFGGIPVNTENAVSEIEKAILNG
ncbi:DNA-processing protein DprA [Thermodesulfobacteriota bacterium]